MKIALIVLLAVVAMAASQGVHVVNNDPSQVHVVDHNPYDVHVVDHNPYEVHVVDRNPLEVHVVDHNPLEVQVVNNIPYVKVVDQPSLDLESADPFFGQRPDGQIVGDPFFGQKPNYGQQYQPIHKDPYIVNPPNYRPKEFPPYARDGKN